MYSPDDFEVTLPYDANQNPTPPLKWLYDNWKGAGEQMTPQTAMMLDDQQIKEAMALSAGMMAFVDDAIGDVMQGLRDAGLYEDTVVCFNSDHGDYMGDYNMILKGALQYRSITQVPFIWSDPDTRRADATDAICSTVDIAATILDRAGIAPFNGNQGQSFLSATQGGDGPREEALIEYNDGGRRLGFAEPARVRSVVTKDWRYTVYRDQDWGELYDLKSDPKETNNLWDDPAHAKTRAYFAERLNHHLIAQMDESPLSDRIA